MAKAQWENIINLVLGIWLFVSPGFLSHDLSGAAALSVNWNSWIVGVLVVVAAAMALQELKPWEEWVNMALGVWVILSPWIFGYSGEKYLLWNSIIVGSAVLVFSGIALPTALKLEQRS